MLAQRDGQQHHDPPAGGPRFADDHRGPEAHGMRHQDAVLQRDDGLIDLCCASVGDREPRDLLAMF